MKATIFTSVICFLWFSLCAQLPQAVKYQAVVRDQAGQILENKSVLFRISVLAGSSTGTLVYRESHPTVSTNAFGLATLDVGKGVPDQGTFSSISWGSGEHYLKVEVYLSVSSGWQDMGTTQLLSVPYALLAKDVLNNNDGDASPTNEIQKLSLSGTVLTLDNGGGSVILPTSGTGGDNWGTQVVKTNPPLTGQGTDSSPLGITQGELQPDWSKVQNKPAGFADGVDNVDDADNNPKNELQTLTLTGNTLGISNGNSVSLPPVMGDNWGSEVVHTAPTLAGQGTTASPLDIARQSATTGQVLKWDGSTWKPAPDEMSGGSGTNPVGPAGGDLTGTYPNPVIGDGKVTSAKVLDGTVANADLADNSVTSAKISDGTIANADLADNAVNSAKILDASVAAADLANSSVTADKLGTLAVSPDKIQNSAVTTDKIANLSVTTDKLANNTVTVAKLPSGATSDKFLRGDGTWALPSGTGLTLPWSGSTSHSGFGFAVTNSSASAISGKATSTSGEDYGLYGESMSVSGSGVYGKSAKYGVYGEAVRTSGILLIYGVFGKTEDSKGYGVCGQGLNGGMYGIASSESGTTYGIIGTTLSPDGTGVAGTSAYRGIYGGSTGYKGRAVMGEASGTNSIGVMGLSTNTGSTGVWGEGSNQGVYGLSEMATGKGVFGQVTSSTGYSGYFDGGKFYVNGRVGIGTSNPTQKLHVNGSAEIKDTLFADVVKTANSPRVFYKKFAVGVVKTITTKNSWGPLDTITVEAPGPGFVMLNFTGSFSTNHTYLDGTWVGVGISARPTGNVLAQTWWEFEHQLVGGYYQSPAAVNTVTPVSSAGTFKYYIVGYHWGTSAGEDVVKLENGSFSALFIPTP